VTDLERILSLSSQEREHILCVEGYGKRWIKICISPPTFVNSTNDIHSVNALLIEL